MSALIPTPTEDLELEMQREALEVGRPTKRLARRHVPIRSGAQVLSVIGLTGDNLPVGFSLGDLDADTPHTIVVVGEPRDPALAVRAAARLADFLDPLLNAHANGGNPMQLLVDSSETVNFLHAWTYRLRSPWLPGPYATDPDLVTAADRSKDAFALLRAVRNAADIPGSDVVLAAVGTLNDHLMFPLAGRVEAQQLPVLLSCLRRSGAAITLNELGTLQPTLIDDVELAEDVTVGSATAPVWDNLQLLPALAAYKRIRNRAAHGDQLLRIDPTVLARAARVSGLDTVVRHGLLLRHQATCQAFRILRELSPLQTMDGRASRAAWRVSRELNRGASHDVRQRDFPSLRTATRAADDDANLIAEAVIDAVRDDDRAWAFARARGEAVHARVISVSPDGRVVTVDLDDNLAPRSERDWWWLDDTHPAPVVAYLNVHPATPPAPMRATLQITAQIRRVQAGVLQSQPDGIRLVCLDSPFRGRPWRPNNTAVVLAV